ncbi:MAG: DUF4440 domain-containing protein [Alteraurantiacibacter sp.]
MIGSILKVWQEATPAQVASDDADRLAQPCLTRAGFLRAMAAGAIAAGFSRPAFASGEAVAGAVPPVTDIDMLYDAWQERFNAGDLEALVDLYVEDVTYINPDGVLMFGKAAVRVDFAGLLSINPRIVLGNRRHYLYRDVALTTNHWRMNFTNAEGVNQELTGGGIEVMQKQADGGWRYIIDDAARSASR